MGLDMYFSKKTYVKNWDHIPKEKQFNVSVKRGEKDYSEIDPKKIKYIEEEIAYWRKANHIHRWFVENVQDGNDDCREYYVSKNDIKRLLETCERVLKESELMPGKVQNGQVLEAGEWVPIMEDGKYIKDNTVAKELLPISSGFFFGGTDYDQWYYEDVEYTAKVLKELVNSPSFEEGEYYYQSSW